MNVRLAAARAVYRAPQWADMIPKEQNPVAPVGVADPTPAHDKRQNFRSAEVGRLLAVCRTPRERAFVLLGAELARGCELRKWRH